MICFSTSPLGTIPVSALWDPSTIPPSCAVPMRPAELRVSISLGANKSEQTRELGCAQRSSSSPALVYRTQTPHKSYQITPTPVTFLTGSGVPKATDPSPLHAEPRGRRLQRSICGEDGIHQRWVRGERCWAAAEPARRSVRASLAGGCAALLQCCWGDVGEQRAQLCPSTAATYSPASLFLFPPWLWEHDGIPCAGIKGYGKSEARCVLQQRKARNEISCEIAAQILSVLHRALQVCLAPCVLPAGVQLRAGAALPNWGRSCCPLRPSGHTEGWVRRNLAGFSSAGS